MAGRLKNIQINESTEGEDGQEPKATALQQKTKKKTGGRKTKIPIATLANTKVKVNAAKNRATARRTLTTRKELPPSKIPIPLKGRNLNKKATFVILKDRKESIVENNQRSRRQTTQSLIKEDIEESWSSVSVSPTSSITSSISVTVKGSPSSSSSSSALETSPQIQKETVVSASLVSEDGPPSIPSSKSPSRASKEYSLTIDSVAFSKELSLNPENNHCTHCMKYNCPITKAKFPKVNTKKEYVFWSIYALELILLALGVANFYLSYATLSDDHSWNKEVQTRTPLGLNETDYDKCFGIQTINWRVNFLRDVGSAQLALKLILIMMYFQLGHASVQFCGKGIYQHFVENVPFFFFCYIMYGLTVSVIVSYKHLRQDHMLQLDLLINACGNMTEDWKQIIVNKNGQYGEFHSCAHQDASSALNDQCLLLLNIMIALCSIQCFICIGLTTIGIIYYLYHGKDKTAIDVFGIYEDDRIDYIPGFQYI